MNENFATLLTSRLTDLTSDLRFTLQPDGSTVAPKIVETMLPPKESGYEEGEELPMVRWTVVGGEFARMRPAPFSVMIIAGIYTEGDIVNGTRDITSLVTALGKIVKTPWFKPYKLRNPVSFSIGDQDKASLGMQPHPYYWATLHLQFIVASGHGG